jgi:hypothetical protein
MTDFSHILNWRLRAGSHDFPGPDGGTCITEAAIVAMGFEYRKIASSSDCPICFSHPISQYAICLNDRMPDDIRNELLMPFVTRLGGTKDVPEVEAKRSEFIIVQIARRIIAKQLEALEFPYGPFFNACTRGDVRSAARAIAPDLVRVVSLGRAFDLVSALDSNRLVVVRALALAQSLARPLSFQLHPNHCFWSEAVAILDEAIMLGNHPDQIEQSLVVERLNKVRERVEAS